MLFERGQKFHIKNAEYFVEIVAKMNGSQGIHKRYPSEDHCDVLINGAKAFMSESQLMIFLRGQKKEEKKPEVVEPPKQEFPDNQFKVIDKPDNTKVKIVDKETEDIIAKSKIKPEKKGGLFQWKK